MCQSAVLIDYEWREFFMIKQTLALALTGAAMACATPQTSMVEKEECITVPENATGSRVESTTVCQPASPD
jgi:hypothetical protein